MVRTKVRADNSFDSRTNQNTSTPTARRESDESRTTVSGHPFFSGPYNGIFFSMNDDIIFEGLVIQPYRSICYSTREAIVPSRNYAIFLNQDTTYFFVGVFAPFFNVFS